MQTKYVYLLYTFLAGLLLTASSVQAQIAPGASCSAIPTTVSTWPALEQAVSDANNGSLCPGADIIDLGGNALSTANDSYGGAALPDVTSDITIQNGELLMDGSGFAPALIQVMSSGALTLENVRVFGAGASFAFQVSPSVIVNTGTLTARNSIFDMNIALFEGSGDFFIYDSELNNTADFLVRNGGSVQIVGSTIRGTVAYPDYTVAVPLITASDVTIISGYLTGNFATPGVFMEANSASYLINNVVESNVVETLSDTTQVYVTNNTFYDNTFTTLAQGVVDFQHNALWSNSITTVIAGSSSAAVDYNASDTSLPSGTGNISLNSSPFVNAPDDYAPAAGSVLIDAGNDALLPADTADIDNDSNTLEDLPLDYAGNPRINGADVDIGALESSGSAPASEPDVNGDSRVTPIDAIYVINRLGGADAAADVNNDGSVTSADVQVVLDALGQ